MGEAPDLTLWGVGTSRTIRPHWAMHELGLSYRTKAIGPRTGETKTAEYTRLNPRQKVPLLQDGDFCIGESAAIVAYLSRMYSTPERSLVPETPREYAVWLEWCFFVIAELDSTSLYVMRRHRADALGPIYGVAPEVVAKAGEYFREQLHHVEVALADGRQFCSRPAWIGPSLTASAFATTRTPISNVSRPARPTNSPRWRTCRASEDPKGPARMPLIEPNNIPKTMDAIVRES